MDYVQTVLEISKYALPALIVLAASYLTVKKFLTAEMQRKQVALFKDSQDITLRLRLQAYERMVLFVERISSRQLTSRVYDSSMSVRDLQVALTLTIKSEFEHNLSQQIYVSNNVWNAVKGVKEQQISMVNHLAKTIDPDAPGKELYTRILDVVLKAPEELPTDVALRVINDEVRQVLSFNA